MIGRAAALVVPILAAPAASASETFYDTYIGERNGVAPCYARTYDEEHLEANPKQRVRRFYVIHTQAEDLRPPETFEVLLGYMLRGIDDYYSAEAGCALEGGVILCSVDGDAGSFKLSPNSAGLRVTIDDRLHLEGRTSFSPDLAKGGGDRVHLLHPGRPEECRFSKDEEEVTPVVD